MMTVRPGSWSSAHHRAPTTDLHLLRHGETALTPERRFSGTGSASLGLSDVGREQAHRAARAPVLTSATIAEVVSSPLQRCLETADIVAAGLGLPVRIDDELREIDFGAWEGLTYAEVEERHPADLAAWKRSADVAPTGSAETFADVYRRVAEVERRLCSAHPDASVLVVSHVTPIKAFVASALNASPLAFFAMELSSAALCRLSCTGDERLLRSFNDVSHNL